MAEAELFQVNLEEVIKSKSAKLAKRLPNFVVRMLEKIICQDELNRVLRTYPDVDGVDFIEAMIQDYNVGLNVHGIENIRKDGRYVFASNHPLGGMDGMCQTVFFDRFFDGKVKCLVNDLLLYIPQLRPPFIAINKYGTQNRETAQRVSEVFASENQIITFPSGLVSRFRKGRIQDIDWKKAFIAKARESGREVVPVFFKGLNTRFFYTFAFIRKWIGIKFNIELFFLPREMVKSKNKTFDLYIGVPITYEKFDTQKNDANWAAWVREQAYRLPNN